MIDKMLKKVFCTSHHVDKWS